MSSSNYTSTGHIVALMSDGNLGAQAEIVTNYTAPQNEWMSAIGLQAETVAVAFRLTPDSRVLWKGEVVDGRYLEHKAHPVDEFGHSTIPQERVSHIRLQPDQYHLAHLLLSAGFRVGP